VNSWLSFVNGSFAGPVCLVITIVGLVLSVIVWRKKGARSGIRGVAWSLLPFAVWLTHALGLVGRIVSAVVQFGTSFVFSPKAWLGVILLLVAALLFMVSGGIPLVRWRRKHDRKRTGRSGRGGDGGQQVAVQQPKRSQPAVAPADDDLSDVRDILKRHGIS
jgi:hypothetical protein